MSTLKIPLLAGAVNAHQKFTVQLGDNLLLFNVNYVTVAGPAWSVDISREGVTLISGAMLEPGVFITDNYNADIGTIAFLGDPVTIDNLGINNYLVWTDEPV